MKRFFSLLCLLFLSGITFASTPTGPFEEDFRIKIWNQKDGTVEVSRDKGKNWQLVGSVLYPMTKTNPEGYAASRWVLNGKVAATAVNAIHIKTSTEADGRGVLFSILPREFLQPPHHYRSYLSPNSSAYTDIPAGQAIFGGGLSPFVGNMVMVSQKGKEVIALPRGYVPKIGDKIYILVDRPKDYPKEIIFENSFGGRVIAKYWGGEEKTIAEVLRPVIGVGRFEGTKYASVGRIRANHAGVIDVSTSPLGVIGGFQIVPSQHGSGMNVVREKTQWLVVSPLKPAEDSLEGKAPLFKYFIKPEYGADDFSGSSWEAKVLSRFLVEVKIKGNDKWQPPPLVKFDDYDLTGAVPDWANNALEDITHIRILFPVI